MDVPDGDNADAVRDSVIKQLLHHEQLHPADTKVDPIDFSQAAIEQKQIHEIHDLAQHVPSLGVSMSQSDSNALYSGQVRLRGLPNRPA